MGFCLPRFQREVPVVRAAHDTSRSRVLKNLCAVPDNQFQNPLARVDAPCFQVSKQAQPGFETISSLL